MTNLLEAWIIYSPVVSIPALMVGIATKQVEFSLLGVSVVTTQLIAMLALKLLERRQ